MISLGEGDPAVHEVGIERGGRLVCTSVADGGHDILAEEDKFGEL